MTDEEQKQTLVNGKPVENEDEDEATPNSNPPGDNEPDAGESPGQPESEAGTGEPGSVGFTPPGSVSDIKQGFVDRIERIKKDGPEPIRQAAKGIVDKVFDAIDSGMERWFGDKK